MSQRPAAGRRVWVDLANSPHIPFFVPIVAALEAADVDVVLTARDFAQTLPMARAAWPERPLPVVDGWGRGRVAKAAAVATRAVALARAVRPMRPSLGLSHNSYAAIAGARALRLPAITLMDYEHQPANHLAFRLASRVVVPEVFPAETLRRQGARRVSRYAGFKEQVYLDQPREHLDVRAHLGLPADAVLAVLRPPPDFAAYHQFDNPLFDQAVDLVLARGGVGLLLARTPEQRLRAEQRWGDRVLMPTDVLPGLELLAQADLVLGGGGTMNREAALLGTPTYTLFAGERSAVDDALVAAGSLVRVATAAELDAIAVVRKPTRDAAARSSTGDAVCDRIVGIVLDELSRT